MRRNGFSLLEVALALSVGLAMLAAGVYTYKQYTRGMQINKAKLMLASMRQEIAMQRYRTGSYPVLGADYVATPSIRSNTTDLKAAQANRFTPFYDLGYAPTAAATNNLLADPLYPPGGGGSPITSSAVATASWGGWIYNQTTGALAPNLPDSISPGDPPRLW